MNVVKLNICGTDYIISTDDTQEYMSALAKVAQREINSLIDSKKGFTIQSASVFSVLANMDRAFKAELSLKNEKKDSTALISKLKATAESTSKKVRKLEGRLATIGKENQALKDENAVICDINASLETDILRLKAKLNAKEKELKIALHKLSHMTKGDSSDIAKENDNANIDIKKLVNENAMLKAKMDILEGKIKLFEAENMRTQKAYRLENEALKKSASRIEEKNKSLEKENRILKEYANSKETGNSLDVPIDTVEIENKDEEKIELDGQFSLFDGAVNGNNGKSKGKQKRKR